MWLTYLNEKILCAIGRTIAARDVLAAYVTSIPIGMDGWLTTFKSLDISAMALYPVPKPVYRKKKRKSTPGLKQQKFGKDVRIEDDAYHKWIISLPCIITRTPGPSDPHHINKKGHGSMSSKTDDTREIPLRHELHQELHLIGQATFAKKYGLNYEEEIERLNKIWQTIGK